METTPTENRYQVRKVDDPGTHRVRWYGFIDNAADSPDASDPGVIVQGRAILVPRNRHMRGGDWSWEVICSCGEHSRLGGGTEAAVKRWVEDHRHDVEHEVVDTITGRVLG